MKIKNIIKFFVVIILLSHPALAVNSTVFNINKVSNTLTQTFYNNIHSQINIIDDADKITSIKFTTLENSGNMAYSIKFSNNITYYVKYTQYYEYTFFGYGGIPYRNEQIYLTVKNASNTTQSYSIYQSNLNYSYILGQNPVTDVRYDINSLTTTINTYPHAFSFNASHFETELYIGMPSSKIIIDSTVPFDLMVTVDDIGIQSDIKKQKSDLSPISGFIYFAYSKTIGLIFGDSEIILDMLTLLDILFSIIKGVFILVFVYPYLILMYILISVNIKSSYESNSLREFMLNYGRNLQSVSKSLITIGVVLWSILLKIIEGIVQIGSFLRQLLQI